MVDDLKKGYYLLFIDGGKRAGEQGQAEGAIGVILQEPDCGKVLARVTEKVGPVGSPQEAEYLALIRGLELAAERGLQYVAAFSDSAHVVNQVIGRWDRNERAADYCKAVEEALKRFTAWQLSWVPRKMNGGADKLVDQAFKGEPVIHAVGAPKQRQFPQEPKPGRHFYVVARFDTRPDGLDIDRSSFLLTRCYWDEADAQAQAEQLNSSRANAASEYFVLPVRVTEADL